MTKPATRAAALAVATLFAPVSATASGLDPFQAFQDVSNARSDGYATQITVRDTPVGGFPSDVERFTARAPGAGGIVSDSYGDNCFAGACDSPGATDDSTIRSNSAASGPGEIRLFANKGLTAAAVGAETFTTLQVFNPFGLQTASAAFTYMIEGTLSGQDSSLFLSMRALGDTGGGFDVNNAVDLAVNIESSGVAFSGQVIAGEDGLTLNARQPVQTVSGTVTAKVDLTGLLGVTGAHFRPALFASVSTPEFLGASASFGNSLTLVGVSVFDQAGNQEELSSLLAGSGEDFGAIAAANAAGMGVIPLPAPGLLLPGALGPLWLLRRRQA